MHYLNDLSKLKKTIIISLFLLMIAVISFGMLATASESYPQDDDDDIHRFQFPEPIGTLIVQMDDMPTGGRVMYMYSVVPDVAVFMIDVDLTVRNLDTYDSMTINRTDYFYGQRTGGKQFPFNLGAGIHMLEGTITVHYVDAQNGVQSATFDVFLFKNIT